MLNNQLTPFKPITPVLVRNGVNVSPHSEKDTFIGTWMALKLPEDTTFRPQEAYSMKIPRAVFLPPHVGMTIEADAHLDPNLAIRGTTFSSEEVNWSIPSVPVYNMGSTNLTLAKDSIIGRIRMVEIQRFNLVQPTEANRYISLIDDLWSESYANIYRCRPAVDFLLNQKEKKLEILDLQVLYQTRTSKVKYHLDLDDELQQMIDGFKGKARHYHHTVKRTLPKQCIEIGITELEWNLVSRAIVQRIKLVTVQTIRLESYHSVYGDFISTLTVQVQPIEEFDKNSEGSDNSVGGYLDQMTLEDISDDSCSGSSYSVLDNEDDYKWKGLTNEQINDCFKDEEINQLYRDLKERYLTFF